MSYSTVPTVATGDSWTAAQHNTYIRDNEAALKTLIDGKLAEAYPVGCIYITTVATNPASIFGFGTWAAVGAGRVLVGAGTSDATYAAGATGGESNHTLITGEVPAHSHQYSDPYNPGYKFAGWTSGEGNWAVNYGGAQVKTNTNSVGGGGAHNNMPPYLVVYMWQRTA